MVCNCSTSLSLEVKEGVVREIYRRSLICSCTIGHLKLVILGQCIAHTYGKITRKTILSIGRGIAEQQRVFCRLLNIPHNHIKTLQSAVQGLTIIILRSGIFYPLKGKLSATDTVCHATHNRAEKALARIVNISVEVLITKHYISHLTISICHPERYYTRTEVCHLHSKRTICKRIELCLLTIDSSLKILCLHKVESSLCIATTADKEHCFR